MLLRFLPFALLLLAAGGASAEPMTTLRDMQRALLTCARAAPEGGGSEVTVRFSLKRDGSLLGRPRITFAKLSGSPEDQRQYVSEVLGTLERCLPLSLSDSLGASIAGRPLTLHFGAKASRSAAANRTTDSDGPA